VKVLIADKFEASGIEGLKALGCEVISKPEAGGTGLAAVLAESKPAVLIVRSSKVSAAALQTPGIGGTGGASGSPGSLKLIIRAGAGVDNIDMLAANAASIAVANCPGMNAVAVAELTMGLLLSMDRRIADQTASARAGQWNKKEFGKARGLKGLTLGVVGAGAIGRAVVKRALSFEMKVLAWSRSITQDHARDLGAEFGGTDTPALLAMASRCDAISIHLPATGTTNKLIGLDFFKAMKPGAYFINTSRGSIVDEAALRDAMKTKNLRVALDVYDNAPAAAEGPWQNATVAAAPANAGHVFTHHIGASTDQAQQAIAAEVVRIVEVFKSSGGKQVENRVMGG
jgi:D-3-phosphoglycerate dehydrogenase / 2-oxoglutarate reductase